MASAAGLSSAEAYTQLKAQTTELLTGIGEALTSLLDAPASDAHQDSHIDLTSQLGAFFGSYYKLRKRLERESLSVAVLALTKSGKSTLINAFLANEILPVNNVPETARICRISHVPAASCPEPVLELLHSNNASGTSRSSSLASGALDSALSTSPPAQEGVGMRSMNSMDSNNESCEVLVGAGAIREHLQQLNRDVRAREHLRNDEKILNISAPLVVLDPPGAASASSSSSSDAAAGAGAGTTTSAADLSSIQLCLLDTPGPNEAGEEGLKYQVERLLGRVDAAIYLLDYTKLKTAEEAGVLGRLKAINPTLVKRLCSRLFFAVNKMDQADESCGLDEEETRAYVAEIVTQQLNCPDFKLHPDQVLLLSARDTLLSRLILSGRSDQSNTQRFCRIAFGAYSAKPRGGGAATTQNPNSLPGAGGRSIDELRAAAEGLLGGSGVPELEERVLGFLCEAAAGVKLMATLDDTGRLLAEVSNVSSSCRAALAASSSALADKTASLQSQLDATLSHFDRVMEGTTELQVEVTDELRAHLSNLRTRLFQYITNALDYSDALRSAHAAAAGAGVDGADGAAADDNNTTAEGAEEVGGGSGSGGEDGGAGGHHRRHRRHRRHGGCGGGHHSRHSSHRRRHGANSSSSSAATPGAAGFGFGGCGAGGGGGFGGGGFASGTYTYAGADVFTGCMPGGGGAASYSHFGSSNNNNGGASSSSSGNGGYDGAGSSSSAAAAGSTQPAGNNSIVPMGYVRSGSGSSGGGGWWGLRQRFLSLFGRVGGGSSGGLGGSGSNGGSSESRDELSSALMDLSEDLMAQIQAEVAEAWHVMEGATNERAGRLITTLNGHIQQLGAHLEGAVNEALQIQLEPVTLRLSPPDAMQFHADLTELIEKGIRAQQTRHVRTGERTDFVMEARRGSCRLTQYYVQVPRRRRIIETYTATTYSLAPEAVMEHFMGVVDEAISATEASLPGYVREYVRCQVDKARNQVQEYGSRYVDSLSAALEATSAGAEARAAALAQVSAYCAAFEGLRGRLIALQSRAELLVPHNTASGCGLFEQVFGDEEEEEQEGEGEEGSDEGEEEGSEDGAAEGEQEAEETAQQEQGAGFEPAVQLQQEDEAAAGFEPGLVAVAAAGAAAVGAAAAAFTGAADEPPSTVSEAAATAESEAEGGDNTAHVVDDTTSAASAAADDTTPAATAVAAMGSSSFFSAPFGTLASWMGTSSSREAVAATTATEGAAAGVSAAEVGVQQLQLQDSDIEGAVITAAAVAADAGADSDSDTVGADSGSDTESQAPVPPLVSVPPASNSGAALMDVDAAALAADAAPAGHAVPAAAAAAGGNEVAPEASAAARAARAAARVAARAAARAAVIGGGADTSSEEEGEEVPALLDTDIATAAPPAPAAVGAADVDAPLVDMPELLDVMTPVADTDTAVSAAPAPPAAPAAALEVPAPLSLADPAAAAGLHNNSNVSRRSSDGASSSSLSAAETAVSDTFSLVSGAATGSSAFSGMTAGTAFTLQSSASSGVSRQQEHLADSVLMGLAVGGGAGAGDGGEAAVAACEGVAASGDEVEAGSAVSEGGAAGECAVAEAEEPAPAEEQQQQEEDEEEGTSAAQVPAPAPAAPPSVCESMYASMYGSGLLLSADDVVGALQMSALPAAGDAADVDGEEEHETIPLDAPAAPGAAVGAVEAVEAVAAPAVPAVPAPAPAATAPTASAIAPTAAEGWQGDASLYASIIAHSEDPEQQPGSPFNFGQSFAAALTAAGLDSLSAGPSPPSGSPREGSGSDDWQIVEAEVEGARGVSGSGVVGGEAAGEQGEGATTGGSGGGAGAASGSGSRSWLLGGRGGKA